MSSPPEQSGTDDTGTETYDYGALPVDEPHRTGAPGPSVGTWDQASLDLPPIEDTASIQLALIEILQALAANQLDTKRAGLLLYGLQVASADAKHCKIPSHGVRSITYTDDGIPFAPQEYGYDLEDIEEEIRRGEEGEDEEVEEFGFMSRKYDQFWLSSAWSTMVKAANTRVLPVLRTGISEDAAFFSLRCPTRVEALLCLRVVADIKGPPPE